VKAIDLSEFRRTYLFMFHRRFMPLNRTICRLPDAVVLVDAALLVFLFFLVSSSFVLQPGITVDLPAAPFRAGENFNALVVTISQEGMIFFNDERTTMEGLASEFAQAAHENPKATLMIEADSRVSHGTLVDIYNMAVKAGIRKVSLATRVAPETMEPSRSNDG